MAPQPTPLSGACRGSRVEGRLVNAPIYQLLTIQAARGGLEGTVGVTEFVSYALTMDLLEPS